MPVDALVNPPISETAELKFCKGAVTYTLACPTAAQHLLQPNSVDVRPLSALKLRCMFTCSYNRWERGKNQAFLDRSLAMEPLQLWQDYAQVLIVRKDQVKSYMEHCGKHYIIVGLPASMNVQLKQDEEHIQVLRDTLRNSGAVPKPQPKYKPHSPSCNQREAVGAAQVLTFKP